MYRLIRFNEISLDQYDQVDDIGSGATPTSWHNLPSGGALDNFGAAIMRPNVVRRAKSLRLSAETASALDAAYDALLSLYGVRGRLYRQRGDESEQWMHARCVSVNAQISPEDEALFVLSAEITFETFESTWRGEPAGGWYFDDGFYLDDGLFLDAGTPQSLSSSPTVFTETVGAASDAGRAVVRSMSISISAGDAAMSSITLARTDGETLTFNGTIAAGESLLINTGVMRVTNNGVDAYDDLVFTPTADMGAWFTLLPGDNEITVTFTGGGSGAEIELTYFEAWR